MILRLVLAAIVLATTAHARTLSVGPGQAYPTPSAAAAVAQDGDEVAIQPGRYVDCAVWRANRLTITGVGPADRVVIENRVCEWKAIFVTKGDGITVRNLTLARASVPWGNGAGIRGEGRDLVVQGVRFIGNQNGILSGTEGGSMRISDSFFDGNGSCIEACAHGVYVGRLDLLVVDHSRFIRTREGHHIKSRARRTEVLGCTILDGPGGTASYEIEAPYGGALVVRGNTIEKGPNTGNHTAISIGAEGVKNPTPEIVVEGNRFRNDFPSATTFVTNFSATPAVLRANAFSGLVTPLHGPGRIVPR
ncbi:MAG TPA: hypothetical protein VE650_01285 [Acetobacteraceae bacterium]|nr:hypothetical protein [Acetobacteraceae bacterium]